MDERLVSLRSALWGLMESAHGRGDLEIPLGQDVYHVVGTVPLAALLAQRRGMDRVLATAAMLMHDAGRLLTGRVAGHQLSGLDWTREALLKAGFTAEEAEQIGQAVAKHTEKESVGDPLEELVKDADVLEVYLAGAVCPASFQGRLERLKAELGMR